MTMVSYCTMLENDQKTCKCVNKIINNKLQPANNRKPRNRTTKYQLLREKPKKSSRKKNGQRR